MSLHFDPSFDWLWVLVAGQQAPKVDVAATRALAQNWLDSGRTLQELADGVAQLVGSVEHAIGGRAGRAFREQVTRVLGQVPRIALITGVQSSSLLDLALNVEHSVYAMMVEIAFFAASILWALSSPFTAPLVPSFITSARIAVQQISMRLHWAVRLIGEAVEGGVEEVVQDAIAQLSQVAEGNRHRWDGTSSLISFVAGGAAEGLAGGMHLGVGRWKPRVEDTAAFHGAAEAVADVVVGAGTAGVLGGSMNDLWAGAVGGAFSGAAEKKAHDAGEAIDRLVNGDAVKVPALGAIGDPGAGRENGPVADEGGTGAPGWVVVEENPSVTGEAGTWAGGGGAARGAVPLGRESGTSAGGGVHADGGARASGGGRPGAVTGPGSGLARNGGVDAPLGGRVAPLRGGVPAAVEVPRDVAAGGPPAAPGTGDGPQAGPVTGSSPAGVRPAAGSSPAVAPLVAGPSTGVVPPATGSSTAVVRPAAGSSPAVVPPAAESSAADVPAAGPFTPQTSPTLRDEVQTAPITGGRDALPEAQPRAEHGLTASPPSGQAAPESSATHLAAVNDPQSAPSAQETRDDRASGRDVAAAGADPSRQHSDEAHPGDDHRIDARQGSLDSADETRPAEAGGTSTGSGGRVTAALPPSTEVPQAPGQNPDTVSQVVRPQTPVAPEQATDIAHRSVISTLEQPAVNGRRLLIELHRLMEVPGAQDRSYQLAQVLSAAHEDGRLSGADYERALQVMGRVTTFLADPAAEMPLGSIAVGPEADPAELPSVWELVREVDARVQRQDFEGAVTLLDGLGRDPQAVRVVEDAYWDEFREDLGTELRRLRPDESAYVDHLLGGVITDPVSREQADAWFAQLRELTFDDHLFGERRLPYDYADDGCTYRAHRMAVALQQRGADPRKVVIGGPGLGTAEVEWDFHIAVAVAVVTPNSREWVVFDPSVNAERPLSIDDWARAAGADRVRRYQGTAEVVQQQLMDDQRNFPARWDDGYPVDVPVLVLTDSHVYGFPDLVGPHDTSWAHADAESRAAIVEMREFYALAAERRVDRALADIAARVDLEVASEAGVSVDVVRDALSALAEREPVGVSGLFDREPEPLRRLLHLLPDHADAIEDAVTPGGAFEAGAQPERTGVVQRGRIRAVPGHDAVERSAFEVRRFATGDGPITEVTVRIALDPEGRHDEATREALLRSAQAGVDRYFNSGRDGGPLRRPDGEPLWFRLLPADGTSAVHHVVTMDPGRLIDQTNWHPGQSQEHSAHEFGHMLGLVDETTNQGGGLDVSGTLMGRWSPDAVPAGGLRMPRRFTDVLDLFIGDVPLDDFATVFPGRPVADLPQHTVVPEAPRLREPADLRLAGDGTLAVPGLHSAEVEHASEFFATTGVLDRAREVLRGLGSGVALDVGTTTVAVGEPSREQVLHRVVPLVPPDVSSDFAGVVHGAGFDTVLFTGPDGTTATAPINADDGLELTALLRLADSLTVSAESGEVSEVDVRMAVLFTGRHHAAAPGLTGHAPESAGRMDDLARRVGVNRYAWARPGQVYVTMSGGADGRHLGYHFAAVVAESADGQSQITLESHPRAGKRGAAAPRWHFRMYGKGSGETFHDQRPEGALTVVVLGGVQPPSPASVWFDEGARTAPANALAPVRAVARQVARAALLRAEHGLTPPTAVITGRGNGRSGPFGVPVPTSAARARAELVRDEFVAAVRRELVVLRGGDAPASTAEVEVRLVTEAGTADGGVPAEEMRRATVEIDYDGSRTAPQRAEAEYDRAVHGLTALEVPRTEVRAVAAEYAALAAGGRLEHLALPPGTRERLVSLNDVLTNSGEPGEAARVRAFVTEALLAAALVPTREVPLGTRLTGRDHAADPREIRPITADRLTAVLDDLAAVVSRGEDPFTAATSSLRGIHLHAGTALPVRLATLGLANLSAAARTAVVASPLFAALRDNPSALAESLFAGAGHEEQYFITTCVAAAMNAAVRNRVPGTAALLHLGRSAADSAERVISRTAAEVRSAADRPFGRSLEDMARGRIAAARSEFDAIERRALTLVAADQGDPGVRHDWRALTVRWSRTMQKLAAADLSQDVVPVLTKKVVAGHWWSSALLAAPALVDRGPRRLSGVAPNQYAALFLHGLALESDAILSGVESATTSRVPLAENLALPTQRAEFWNRLASSPGHVVMTLDHAVHLRAGVVGGRRVFVLSDPMRSHPSVLTAAELVTWAADWEAESPASLLPRDDLGSRPVSAERLEPRSPQPVPSLPVLSSVAEVDRLPQQWRQLSPERVASLRTLATLTVNQFAVPGSRFQQAHDDVVELVAYRLYQLEEGRPPGQPVRALAEQLAREAGLKPALRGGASRPRRGTSLLSPLEVHRAPGGPSSPRPGRRRSGPHRRNASLSTTGSWVTAAEEARAWRAQVDQPQVDGEPDFAHLRSALRDQLRELGEDSAELGRWVDVTFADAKLKQLDRSLEGIREVWEDFEVEVHALGIGAPHHHAVSTTADLTRSETVREAEDGTSAEVVSTPVNPVQGSVPAGPVTVSFSVQGLLGTASERRTSATGTTRETVEITQAGAKVTRTSHDVHHRLRIQPPKRHLHRERPEPVEWKQSVTMTLTWPQFGATASEPGDPLPETPLTAGPALSYPDLAATPDALARARSHAGFERAREALEHVRFVGIDTVFSAVKSTLRLSGSHQEITRLERWLDDLGPKQGKRLVTGEQVEETFRFPGHKPVKVVVRQGKALEGQSFAPGLAQAAARSLGRTVAASHRHSVGAAATHEAGFELGVSAGEELAGLVGVKIGAGVSFSRVNQNLSERVSQVRHELTERIKGDFVDDTISFPFLVVMAEEGKTYRLATLSSDDAHRSFGFLRREDKPLVALHVEAAAVLLFSPVDSDSGNNVGARDEPAPAGTVRAAGARDRSGLSADEVAGYARSRWKLSDVSREAVIGRVVRRLYADGVVSGAQDAQDVQRSLRDVLVDDPRALFGGDPKRISLPGAEKDLFLGGVVAPGGGEYVKKASTKELQGFVATSETTKLTAERTRSKGFKVAVEGDAGPVELGGTAGVTRSEQRRAQISETMEEERAWTGEDVPVHLYRHPAEIEVRTGTDLSDLDPPMTWSERPDPAADAELRTGIAAELEIAVAQRPGRAVDAGPVEPGTESDWVDAGTRPGGAAEFERAADLPKRFEVDSMAAITRLGAETAGLLAVPEPEGSRARAEELAKRQLLGARPAQLGSSGEDDAQDVSRRALEQWVSWQSRQGRLGLAEGPGDELRLENYNGDSGFAPLELGSRRITGTATLTSTYGNARIIGVDEAHEFTRSNATHTTVESHRQRRTGPNAGLTAKVKLGEVATAEAKAAASYLRGPETTETTTVDARTKVAWVERGYLVEFDARHRLTTSARHTWTGPFGEQHDGPVTGGDRRKYVPRAVTLWIPASEVPRIGELSRHDLDHVLLPDDLRAYEAAHTADAVTPPATATSEAGIELGMPEPLRPDLALRMTQDIRELLRDYEKTITDPKVRKQFAGLHDEMVQAFGRRLELGGDQVLANVLNGGSPIFGERLGESGKLEQLVVVSARRVDGADLGVEENFLVDSEVTTTRSTSRGERSEWTRSAGVALPPAIPRWVGSALTGGLVNPAAELAAESRGGQDDRVLSRSTVGYRWSGQARRHGHGMRVTVQVRPWARSGVYRRHLPGLRQTPVRDMQVLPGFTVGSAIQTPVPSVLDLARTPLETVGTPLSDLTHGTGLPVDATISATPFHAEGLHARLAELLPELNAGRANGLLVSTTATQLAGRVVAALSPDGYQVDVGSRTVSTATITFDLGRRQLFGPIPGASLRKTTAEGTGPVVTTEENVTAKAALLDGPIAENLIGKGEVERTLATSRYTSRDAEPVPAEVQRDNVYLVLAELRPTLTLEYRDGRTAAVATGQNGVDGEVWLQVDLAGARALGFTPPGADPGQSTPPTTPGSPAGQDSPATSRLRPVADPRQRSRLTSAYRGATRGRARLPLSETDLAHWVDEAVALSSGAVEQHDLADGTAELLRSLDDALGAVPGVALRDQVRAVLNDAVLAATVVPVRDADGQSGDHRAVRPLSPDRLVHLLTDVARHLERGHDPFTTEGSLLHRISYPVGAPLQSRLAVLATVNLTGPARAKVFGDPLFTALLGNPDALAESLFASAGHESRYFQTTGGAAAVNIAVRDRALTIVTMLHAGDAVVSAMAAALPTTSVGFRTHRDRPLGRVQGSRVRDRIAFAREEFADLRTSAGELAAAADRNPAAWRDLTDRWSRTMQKLAATDLTRPRLPVLTPVAAPGRPHVSGLVAALKLVDMPVRRRQNPELTGYLTALGAVFAPEPDGTAFGSGFAEVAGEPLVPVSTKLTTARSQYGFWSWLAAGPGQVLHGGSSAVHVRAVRLDGRNLVALGDPRRTGQRLHALPEFGDLAHRHGWSAPESLFADDAAFHRHERLGVDLPAVSAVRVDAGVFVGADPDGPLSTAARYLPDEDDVVALVLDHGVALGADDARRVLLAAGWNGAEAVRLYTAHDANPGTDAADLAAWLGVAVTRPTADGWRWYWPDGKQRAGTYALEVPEEVAERFGLPAPQEPAVPVQPPRR
ncbi:protein-glutamine glutaminase family protein [Lentzea sp. E54]|uniref:protein-glutamine glutaminase family protein n=1 Tax=Lentzea xerophila TaxID=3435883 RepID=UPI003DA4F599